MKAEDCKEMSEVRGETARYLAVSAAVHVDFFAGDVSAFVRNKEAHRVGDVFGLANSSEGHVLVELPHVIDSLGRLHETTPHFGFYESRRDDIHADTMGRNSLARVMASASMAAFAML